jgi:hypothetical protein
MKVIDVPAAFATPPLTVKPGIAGLTLTEPEVRPVPVTVMSVAEPSGTELGDTLVTVPDGSTPKAFANVAEPPASVIVSG